ncbi:hypothetical protein PSNIH1_00585 [Pantoea sp. PSNIH1]|nr:hypothetical protein PSNIH1_00585 [Pantoea sp. PSNIH1]
MTATNAYELYHAHQKEIERRHYSYARNVCNRPYRNLLKSFLRDLDDTNRSKVFPRGRAYLRVIRNMA